DLRAPPTPSNAFQLRAAERPGWYTPRVRTTGVPADMELNEILQIALRAGASDIHLKAGLPPMFRVDGALLPLKDAQRLPPEEIARMAFGIMNDYQKERYKQFNECDLAYGVPGLGRFRVSVFQQRGTTGMVFRVIPFRIQTIEQLMLPKVLEQIALSQRGLIL